MYENGFNYLLQNGHEKIIYGVIKKLHVDYKNNDFEDLIEEGKIAFVLAYEDYVARNNVTEFQKLNAFIFQKVKWHLLDVLRKNYNVSQHITCWDDSDEVLLLQDDCATLEEDIATKEIFEQVYLKCSEMERKFLDLRLNTELSLTAIAQQLHVSRKTIYKYKKDIALKLYKYSTGNFSTDNYNKRGSIPKNN
ncbi:sigma-70 family RNA polymerase sigma factor [Ligilactobacillus apodemi]|uniref:Uncharacterized protein n=1 Tax=Ligilactobacillus apodemi DSM 16634 = JCM 16172 TaxID=1423724 RepID=A0A0R1U293_9LACO|nr:sigma-70 family RNA polymerase sigma factor [Ligilactobacillus apodemi]KRL87457.1 hypothetical protein FC32_GL000019 [Ligilactobacillus apodemi DSM 16634 = JCM 16172]MCR1901932.1 HTH domain-containing protein [Ligilactobacillus apodemi]